MRLLFGGPFEGLAVMVPGTLGFDMVTHTSGKVGTLPNG